MILAVVHHHAKLLPNNTIEGGTITHVGQFYFEQEFINDLNKIYPYTLNRQYQIGNDMDALFIYYANHTENPFMKVSKIGKTYEDGLYATIDVGIDPHAIQNWTSPVGKWTAEGTVEDPDSKYAGWPGTPQAAAPSPSPSPSSDA